jgi:hypothetical protein
MTPAERERLRAIAREQNDADYAAGRMPSRYVTDEAVLAAVARIVLDSQAEVADDPAA